MASSILSSLFSKPLVTIAFADSGLPVLQGVKIIRVLAHLTSTMPRHMLEDGSTVSDIRVLHPSTLALEVICPTIDDAESVIAFMADRSSLYQVTSKGVVYRNFMAQSISVKQNAQMLSAAPFRIYMKELQLENVLPVSVAQDADSSLLDRGIQLLTSTTQTVTGLYTNVAQSISGIVSKVTGG